MTKPGFFVTFEGGEGAGKTTQIARIQSYLENAGYDVITTREPGGTKEAEALRDLLVAPDATWPSISEVLLLFAARRAHLDEVIRPALEAGKIVISDRFTDSTRVYQGIARDLGLEPIETVKKLAIGDFEPNLTFIFDLDPEIGLARSQKRGEVDQASNQRYENAALHFHRKMQDGFLQIARDNPQRCVLINADQTPEKITNEITEKLVSHLAEVNDV